MPTGQSGHIMSDHYDDMTQMWLEGKYLKLYFNEAEIRTHAKESLILK
jgi:penicillin amidase